MAILNKKQKQKNTWQYNPQPEESLLDCITAIAQVVLLVGLTHGGYPPPPTGAEVPPARILRENECWKYSVQWLSRVWLFVTPWTAARQASLSITNSQKLLIESVMPSNHFTLCHPLLLMPSIFPSIRVFSKESVLHIRWPKCWSFSFSISLKILDQLKFILSVSYLIPFLNHSNLFGLLQHFQSLYSHFIISHRYWLISLIN